MMPKLTEEQKKARQWLRDFRAKERQEWRHKEVPQKMRKMGALDPQAGPGGWSWPFAGRHWGRY